MPFARMVSMSAWSSTGPWGVWNEQCSTPSTPAAMALAMPPIAEIGSIANWRDAAEFISLAAGTVQVCTAAMVYGFKIVEEMKASGFVAAALQNSGQLDAKVAPPA